MIKISENLFLFMDQINPAETWSDKNFNKKKILADQPFYHGQSLQG